MGLPVPPGTSLSWIPPSSLYCTQKSLSRISAAAAKRNNAASPALRGAGCGVWVTREGASAKSAYPTPTAPAAIPFLMNERRLFDVPGLRAVPLSITEAIRSFSFQRDYSPAGKLASEWFEIVAISAIRTWCGRASCTPSPRNCSGRKSANVRQLEEDMVKIESCALSCRTESSENHEVSFVLRLPTSRSLGYHRPVPVCANAVQQRRVHDQFSERVDCRHIEGRKPADAADVDREVEAVTLRSFNQRGQRRRVDRPVDQ